MTWKLSAVASREEIEEALARREAVEDWDEGIVLAGFEADSDEPDCWQLDAYCNQRPSAAQRDAVKSLFGAKPPDLVAEKLPQTDWVAESQKGAPPIRAGRFYVHTPDFPALAEPSTIDLCIPAAQAFGTGQHATTAGCLAMLDAMQRRGLRPRSIADIGTGTGLLAFAALRLWPRTYVTASDIDPLCEAAVAGNARSNSVRLGTGCGALAMVVSDGMDDPFLAPRAPFDLLVANILAAPLIEMARDFADAVAPRGSILLSGLLATQENDVRAAYRKAGFRLQSRLVSSDWSILWLRQRFAG